MTIIYALITFLAATDHSLGFAKAFDIIYKSLMPDDTVDENKGKFYVYTVIFISKNHYNWKKKS